jgi:transposase
MVMLVHERARRHQRRVVGAIEPLLPSTKPQRGGRWTPHRTVLEGIAWRFRTGTPWRDVPERFGSWNTLHKRQVHR